MNDYVKRIDNRYYYAFFIVLSLPALYAYNPLPLYFLNDDFIHVPLSQKAVWGQRNSIRPFSDVTLYIDSLLWGNSAAGYHFTNLVIHAANTVLVFFLSGQVFTRVNPDTNIKFWSLCCSLLFWGYAFHSESVLWIIGRTGCLSSLFFLICLIIFLSGKRRWYFFILSHLCFFIGLLSYESVFILPVAFVILAFFFKDLRRKWDVVFIAGHWLLFIYYLCLRLQWTGELAGSYEGSNIRSFNIALLVANYLKLLVRSFVAPQPDSRVFLVTVILFFLTVLMLYVKQVKKTLMHKQLIAFPGIFLLSYLPYISLGIDTHGVEAERYLYLPSIFVCLLLVVFFAAFRNQKWALIVFILCFLYNQFYLVKSSTAFVLASDVSYKTMQLVKEHQTARNIFFKNLPKENYGVTIFRLGLEEGVNWQTNNDTMFRKLKINSFNENEVYTLKNNLKLAEASTFSFPAQQLYKRNLETGTGYVLTKSTDVFNPAFDVLIEFTDSNIVVHDSR